MSTAVCARVHVRSGESNGAAVEGKRKEEEKKREGGEVLCGG